MKQLATLIFISITATVTSQDYAASSIFAHNDYAQGNPFYSAYALRIGYIEADVFLRDGKLFVAHYQSEIKNGKTLDAMYLAPLQNEIIKNKGWAYPDSTLQLKLMIDLKTEGISTLKKLINELNAFPELIRARGFQIFISGDVPPSDRWNEFPRFIHFDGRPGIQYSEEQLKRITLISASFREFSKWDGVGDMLPSEIAKLDSLIESVHNNGKKVRFWSSPDFEKGWKALIQLKVDVIGTDKVPELVRFIER